MITKASVGSLSGTTMLGLARARWMAPVQDAPCLVWGARGGQEKRNLPARFLFAFWKTQASGFSDLVPRIVSAKSLNNGNPDHASRHLSG